MSCEYFFKWKRMVSIQNIILKVIFAGKLKSTNVNLPMRIWSTNFQLDKGKQATHFKHLSLKLILISFFFFAECKRALACIKIFKCLVSSWIMTPCTLSIKSTYAWTVSTSCRTHYRCTTSPHVIAHQNITPLLHC